jgi:glycerophosphoryl diester phosphodiesterase
MKIKFITVFAALLLLQAARADTNVQNCVDVTGKEQDVFSIGHTDVKLRPVEPAKPKDPPQVALFVGDTRATRTPIFPGKRYHFAIVSKGGKTQTFVNGQPDGDPLDLDFKAGDLKAISAEQNLSDFKATVSKTLDHPIVTVGHRGDNLHSPENTNISYVNAIANHTPIVEMDLRLTNDNVLVLLHDPTVNRTTNGKGPIVDMTFADAEKLDAGSWKDQKYKGEPIPAVETIFKSCRGKAIAMLDLKCTGLGKSIAELKSKVNVPSDQLILAPWEQEEGVALRQYLPDVPMILLHGKLPTDTIDDAYFAKMKQIGFSAFSINWQILTKEFVDAAHKNGMKIYVWTVNVPIDVAGAALNGADGIITDDAPSTMKLVGELTSH